MYNRFKSQLETKKDNLRGPMLMYLWDISLTFVLWSFWKDGHNQLHSKEMKKNPRVEMSQLNITQAI